ncbi:membrane protein insertase YidC [Aquabacterium sp. A7-Y]|uniref:membrane protein insertase YidC n=1 Tax=Aquabacterium sp. A7-Y TaxID=1349605 RepID=UPI00223C8F43|nr:membrane protein insertase YidC [Aquabacterium sp. A7-Y]MCW7538411.1 membrane protein insertase YidC [Aquabacterium sp. A7-Y]
MTDMRRTILWVVFTMSLVLLWDAWNKHNGRPSMFTPAPPAVTASAPPPDAAGSASLPAAAGTAAGGGAIAAQAPAVAAEKLTITTDVFRAVIDTQGGSVTRLELLRYEDQADAKQTVTLLDSSAQRTYLAQSGLINRQDGGGPFPNHTTVMTALPGERSLAEGKDELAVVLESPVVNGLQYRKTYVFKRGNYAIGVKHEVLNTGDQPREPQLYLQLARTMPANVSSGGFFSSFTSPASTFTGPAVYTDATKFQKIDFADIDANKAELPPAADNGWVAMVEHYFASAWLNVQPAQREFRVNKTDSLYRVAMVQSLPTLAPKATQTVETTLFAGPQEEKKLEQLAPGLELVKDYGWFTILSKPLFWLLDKLHTLIGNWGWAIVALVVLLKIAFYWLNAKAYQSMAKMKVVAPRVQELRERYKDKPQQMQQEMMRIYREEKVNPMGGCFPIMVQIPVFIALYWVLLSSVEMRGAPWVLWITDLSVKDPFFVLPLLMTASTLLQTWLNPTPPDPVQARMMWIMPLVFSVMFFFFPAGLVLYWLTNNLLSIAQQWFINKRLGVLK